MQVVGKNERGRREPFTVSQALLPAVFTLPLQGPALKSECRSLPRPSGVRGVSLSCPSRSCRAALDADGGTPDSDIVPDL